MDKNELSAFFGEQKKVLVVDDVPSARKVVVRLLKLLGIESVEQAANGKEALDKIAAGNISLVISDWEMPQVDGLELLKNVRGDENYKATPFIIITSSSDKDNVITALKSGVSDFVVKPFSAGTLSDKITGVLSRIKS